MSKPSVLYHYCPTEAFKAIIETRSIHLSSITLSNDSKEGKLVTDAFRRVATRNKVSSATINKVSAYMESFADAFDGLAFCLSEEGDLLSQWRGYAANATGVAIGFSAQYLSELSRALGDPESYESFTLGRVVYDPRTHNRMLEDVYLAVKRYLRDTPRSGSGPQEAAHDAFTDALMGLGNQRFLLKSHAFREELEWRLVSTMYRENDIDELSAYSFRACNDTLIPFRRYELKPLQHPPIVEVVLGPKHVTPTSLIEIFLVTHGYEPNVRRSEATYR